MAAITTLASANSYPQILTTASVGTTWQEFTLPRAATYVTISATAAIYVGWNGATDGGAVGTHRRALDATQAGSGIRYDLSASGQQATSVFVAAQASTVTVTIELEKAR